MGSWMCPETTSIKIAGQEMDILKAVRGGDGSIYIVFRLFPTGLKLTWHPDGKTHIRDDEGFYRDIPLDIGSTDIERLVGQFVTTPNPDHIVHAWLLRTIDENDLAVGPGCSDSLDVDKILRGLARGDRFRLRGGAVDDFLHDYPNRIAFIFDPSDGEYFLGVPSPKGSLCLKLPMGSGNPLQSLEDAPIFDQVLPQIGEGLEHTQDLLNQEPALKKKTFRELKPIQEASPDDLPLSQDPDVPEATWYQP